MQQEIDSEKINDNVHEYMMKVCKDILKYGESTNYDKIYDIIFEEISDNYNKYIGVDYE